MANAGDGVLDRSTDLGLWCAVLHRYAEIQIELGRHLDQLTALGCQVFPPAQLGDALLKMLADREALTPANAEFQLTADESALLREKYRHIAVLGQQLAHSPIPLSLDHGDFWSAQILLCSQHPMLIDWSDANITMPFVSLFKYLIPQEVGTVFSDNPAAECALRDAYLDPWTSFASQDQLQEIYHQVQTLAALHYALVNYRLLLPHMEVRWEQANMIPYFLKRLARIVELTEN